MSEYGDKPKSFSLVMVMVLFIIFAGVGIIGMKLEARIDEQEALLMEQQNEIEKLQIANEMLSSKREGNITEIWTRLAKLEKQLLEIQSGKQ